MNKKTYMVIGLSGVLIYGLGKKLLGRRREIQNWRKDEKTVDTTSDHSFPASDPPSWTPVQGASA